MSSEIPRYSGALYTPADEYPAPSAPTTPAPNIVPRWSVSGPSHRRSRSMSSSRRSSRKNQKFLAVAARRSRRAYKWARKRFNSMTLVQKVIVGLLAAVLLVMLVLVLVYHEKLLHAMLPVKAKLRSWRAGFLLLFFLLYISAFPPMIGYSTAVTLSGFVYGFPNGWFIVSLGTILGSTSAFLVCRYYFRSFAKRMVATDRRFAALSLTLKHDGIKLLCMIRLCPLPYSISNGAMSTFPTVSPWAFMFATAVATPKLLIHVWIGERVAVLAEAENTKMDPKVKALNYGSIIFGAILGLGTGWIIYKRTIKRAKQLEELERAQLRQGGSSGEYADDRDDPEAVAAAGLIGGLLEGDELETGGLFADMEDDEELDEDADDVSVVLDAEDADTEAEDNTIIGMTSPKSPRGGRRSVGDESNGGYI